MYQYTDRISKVAPNKYGVTLKYIRLKLSMGEFND